jgi:hypothetical protein
LQFVLHLVIAVTAQPIAASLHVSLQNFGVATRVPEDRTPTRGLPSRWRETRLKPPAHIPAEGQAMAVLAVIIPLLMLGVVLALGRYEELLLPEEDADRYEPVGTPSPVAAVTSSPGPAGTPASSP